MAKDNKSKGLSIKNKKASFEFHLETKFDAGIVLTGSEVKSIKAGHANISDAYCIVEPEGIKIKNMHISEFKNAGYSQHSPLRDRQLLLTKREIKKVKDKLKDKGYTLIPIEVFLSERGFLKLKIALAKGKKNYDKREDLKNKDLKRELERYI
ncbi:MAG: SsrA-binding protein SmpB [Flavobacteriales bacterium]|nr:SsrA-binding protein SmpB [Flavobacteriales bacterium]